MCCFFKQKTAYERRISDWSSDVCSSDLPPRHTPSGRAAMQCPTDRAGRRRERILPSGKTLSHSAAATAQLCVFHCRANSVQPKERSRRPYPRRSARSEEHTSELQSLMRISYAVFCLKNKNTNTLITMT